MVVFLASMATQGTKPVLEKTNSARTRKLRWILIGLPIITAGILLVYASRHGERIPAAAAPKLSATPKQREALLIEAKSIPEFSAQTDAQLTVPSPEERDLGEKTLNILQKVGNSKDEIKLKEATANLSEIIQQHPDYADAYVMRATYSLLLQKPDLDAIKHDLDSAISRRQTSTNKRIAVTDEASILGLRAYADFLDSKYQETLNDLEIAVKTNPDSALNVFNTGGVKPDEEASGTALIRKHFDQLVATFPNDYRSFLFRGLFYTTFTTYNEQYYAPAFSDLNRALSLKSDSPLIHFFLGRITQKMAFWSQAAAHDISEVTGAKGGFRALTHQKALNYFEAAAKLDPKFAAATADAAQECLTLKRYKEAIQYYDMTIALQPDNATAYNDRGLAKIDIGSYFEAVSDFSKSLALKKGHSDVYLESSYANRADAYFKMGNFDAAIQDYTQAIGVKVRDLVVLMNPSQIKRIYPELGDISDENLAEGLRQKYFPAMNRGNFSQKKENFNDFTIAELYQKRGNAEWANGHFRSAAAEFSRATNADISYPIDRWQQLSTGDNNVHYFIDLKTLDFGSGSIAALWLKAQHANSPNHTITNYQIDCGARKIRSVSATFYNPAGTGMNLANNAEWQSIVPESIGEILQSGICP
ncbi:MAG: tetratricopeptide repeat protein [Acidobacteriia bacterium]|nr:tetratricopeptide repeat protein [Terriglobia bacterium]